MDEIAAFERRLTRAADEHVGEIVSPPLAQIFRKIAARRAVRTGGRRGDPGPAEGPTPAAGPAPTEGVVSVTDVGPDVGILRVARPSGLQFRAGQYVKFGVPGHRRG